MFLLGFKIFAEGAREEDVVNQHGGFEERGDFLVRETCYAAADTCYKEGELRVLHGKGNELVYIRFDCFHSALHGWDGVCLAVEAYAFSPYGTKFLIGVTGCSASMGSGEVAAEDKDFSRF